MTRRQARETLNGTRALAIDTAPHGHGFARLAIAALLFGCVAVGARSALAQDDDDWSVVPAQTERGPTEIARNRVASEPREWPRAS